MCKTCNKILAYINDYKDQNINNNDVYYSLQNLIRNLERILYKRNNSL